MKKTIFITSFVLFISMIFLTSCEEDKNNDNLDTRETLVGKWTCVDEESSVKNSYKVDISINEDIENQIYLINFGQIGTAYGVVTDERINIPLQDFGNDGWSTSGTGRIINNNKIEWEYSLENGVDRRDYVASFNKD